MSEWVCWSANDMQSNPKEVALICTILGTCQYTSLTTLSSTLTIIIQWISARRFFDILLWNPWVPTALTIYILSQTWNLMNSYSHFASHIERAFYINQLQIMINCFLKVIYVKHTDCQAPLLGTPTSSPHASLAMARWAVRKQPEWWTEQAAAPESGTWLFLLFLPWTCSASLDKSRLLSVPLLFIWSDKIICLLRSF